MRTLRHRLLALTGVLGLALSASAQQFPSCPLTFAGPDVIVGDVGEGAGAVVQNYNASATIDAVALASTSCNVGNTNLNWIQNTVNHPLIGGSMYKYKEVAGSGRFEQIGTAWMKHAFAAFQQSLCCNTCTGSGLQQFLQPGCSDPYTASRNGTIAMLGPKYQVNPNTGAYISAHPTPSGGGNTGRVEMLLTDLEDSTSSIRYFGEVAYVALDDSRANNNDNNASHRELSALLNTTTSSQKFNFSPIVGSGTVRMKMAVEAWQTVDPAVTLTTIITPEDSVAPYDGNGKMVLGSRVTNLGGGIWHYEYALENLNSDRAVASFRVPAAAGVTVTNIGFHDVTVRGGDGEGGVNRDGTDWPGAKTLTEVGWATTPFATNPNANALRFSTTYNFRFDANAAPTTGTITVGQFKVVNDISVSGVEVPGAPPAFDAFCTNGSFGTDHTTACPCGNTGAAGNGCGHSFDANGANIAATGTPALDDVVLHSQFEPSTSFTLFMQHSAVGDVVFHDGVLCAGGTLIRLRGRAAVAGEAFFPNSTFAQDSTTTLSQRGSVTIGSGARRYYAAWFRNASSTFCPPATANVTNGWMIDW